MGFVPNLNTIKSTASTLDMDMALTYNGDVSARNGPAIYKSFNKKQVYIYNITPVIPNVVDKAHETLNLRFRPLFKR